MNQLVTQTQAANILGVHINTIAKWRKSGALPEVRLGPNKKTVRIRRADLEKLMEASHGRAQ